MGWPYVLSPLAAFLGPNMANGLPAVIALNVLVLAPAAVIGMYLLGTLMAGRLFGLWSAVAFTTLPLIALLFYNAPYRPTLVDSFLPSAIGLNALSDYPSMVCAIYGGYFLLRAMETNDPRDAVVCGVVLGFLVLLKPGNGPLPVAAALTLAVFWRLRTLLWIGVAMSPALVALALWKKAGLGQLPILSMGNGIHEAIGSQPVVGSIHPYLRFDTQHLSANIRTLQEVFWSVRLLEYLFFAGAFGLATRSLRKAFFVVAWFLAYSLFKASAPYARVEDTSVYRLLLPAWPAWVLIVAGVVLCWPRGARRRSDEKVDERITRESERPRLRLAFVICVVGMAIAPVAVAVAARPIARDSVAQAYVNGSYTGVPVPVVGLGLSARRDASAVTLKWDATHAGSARTLYEILRSPDGAACRHLSPGAPVCYLDMQTIGFARAATFTDTHARAPATYRVAVGSGSPDNPRLLLVSKPVTVGK